MQITDEILTGRSREHLAVLPDGSSLHVEVVTAFGELKAKAAADGFQLEIASGFRDFESQKNIWNQKARGQRPLLDAQGNPLAYETLSPEKILESILRWSALPGASRHHWGTDFDVFDAKSLPPGYRLKLVPQEIEPGAILFAFNDWLSENLDNFGFFRPYSSDLGGVSPEWWHLSYAPLSLPFRRACSHELLDRTLRNTDLELKSLVLERLPEIFRRYVNNITLPEASAGVA